MSRVGHDQLVAGAPNAKVALLRWQNIKNIKVKKRTWLRQITGRAVNRNRPMHRRKKSLAMYRKIGGDMKYGNIKLELIKNSLLIKHSILS